MDPSLVSDVNSAGCGQLVSGPDQHRRRRQRPAEAGHRLGVSDDRLTYTFNMRDRCYLVRYSPSGGMQELGPVTAYDVVYGVRQTRARDRPTPTSTTSSPAARGTPPDLNGLSDGAMQALDAVGVWRRQLHRPVYRGYAGPLFPAGIAGMGATGRNTGPPSRGTASTGPTPATWSATAPTRWWELVPRRQHGAGRTPSGTAGPRPATSSASRSSWCRRR